jgi:hypothetical protein
MDTWNARDGLANASEKRDRDRAFVREFVDSVRREDPGALPTIEWLHATGRQEESADLLALSQASCARDKTTVRP